MAGLELTWREAERKLSLEVTFPCFAGIRQRQPPPSDGTYRRGRLQALW